MKRVVTGFLLLALTVTPGCYWSHVASGQARLLWNRRPVEALLADPTTPSELRQRLLLTQQVRGFAAQLGLAVDAQYTSFVDLPGDAVVTSVVAARPGELEPAGFWFPVVGRLPYKGFFDPARADAEARRLGRRGLDTCVSPIVAYSTLGWFEDPLTTPLLRLDEGRLVEVLLHELTHASVFVAGEADFGEGLATFVGAEGARRFWRHHAGAGSERASAEARRLAEDRLVARRLEDFRDALAELYAQAPAGPDRQARRQSLETRTREALAALPLRSRDAAALAQAVRLNDACQALRGAYEGDLPAYARRLEALGGDLRALLEAARRAAETPDPRCSLLGLCDRAESDS